MTPMEEESALRPGYRLDRYELVAPVAQGGMAAVWLAQLRGKRGFEKLFGIKTIKTELEGDTRFQEMFLDEARIASGIEHPNVAHIVDLGEQANVLYIVMEWVDGESLTKVSRLARKKGTPLPLGLTLRLMADACAGLHAAHELSDSPGENLGVVHRAAAPQNTPVAAAGAVKVIDFGVAKARNRRAGETAEGVVKGKVRYMAPEQVKNENVDRRADIWAIGVCLHELATGTLPFDGASDIDIVRKLIDENAEPVFADDLPDEVREILAHSVARDPAERFSTCAAMRRAIENAIVKLDLEARTDDVADFLKKELPELEEKRKEVVRKALNEVNARASMASISDADSDVAFAETVVSGNTGATKATTGAKKIARAKTDDDERPTKRPSKRPMSVQSARAVLAGEEDTGATRTSFVDDEEVAGLPKNRGFFLFAALVALAAGAWFIWPGKVRIREMIPGGHSTPAATEPEPSASAAPSTSASVAVPLELDDAAAAPLVPSATASVGVPASTTRPVPTGTVTATTTVAPTATATVTPTATATVTPTATATEDDPNSPY